MEIKVQRACRVLRVLEDLQVQSVQLDHLDRLVQLVQVVSLELRVPLELLEHQEPQVKLETLELKDTLDHRVIVVSVV